MRRANPASLGALSIGTDGDSYGISDTGHGSSRLVLVTVDPEPTAVPLGTTTLLEGWMHRIPGNGAHASTLGMGNSCSTNKPRKVVAQISTNAIA